VLCLLMLSGAAARAQAEHPVGDFVPGQIVVELRSTGGHQTAQSSKAKLRGLNADYGTSTLKPLPTDSAVYLLKLPAGSSVQETWSRMQVDQRLLYSEPNYVVQPLDGEGRHRSWGVSDAEPSPQDNAASALNLSSAHGISLGKEATVAVLDTGVQLDHPALASNFQNVWRYDFVDNDDEPLDLATGADEDGDGLTDELMGHGTHVAGIIDLVAPEAKIMPLRVLDTEGEGDDFTIAEAMSRAMLNGADVINLSLGSPSRSQLLGRVSADVIEHGVVVVAAAGNSNSAAPMYPAAGDQVGAPSGGLVAVTSVDMYGHKSDFANYGPWVDIAAPGEDVRSAFPVSKYAYWSGTSMATPFVSGEAALIHAVYGSLDPAGVAERISCSARPLVDIDQSYAAKLGAGHADAAASLAPGACDKTASPDTTITAAPWGLTNDASATFAFSSSEARSSFQCRVDRAPFGACSSPASYAGLADGQHTFEVRATDAAGNIDSTPASRTWTVDTTGS
jgi:thermitase